jgi:hypothetical protein
MTNPKPGLTLRNPQAQRRDKAVYSPSEKRDPLELTPERWRPELHKFKCTKCNPGPCPMVKPQH